MPAASGPYIFSQFIKGYMEGARQSQMDRLTRASNLMQIAQMRAKEIDSAQTEEQRAAAWKEMNEHMDEAEKLMKGSDGMWNTISGIWKKKGGSKKDMVDPYQIPALQQLGIGQTREAKMPMGVMTTGQAGTYSANTGQPVPPDKIVGSGIAGPLTQENLNTIDAAGVPYSRANVPSTLGGPKPEGPPPPPEMQATQEANNQAEQKRLGGISSAVWGPGQAPEESVLKNVQLPAQGITPSISMPVPLPEKLPAGVVAADQATGKGLEMVRVGSGQTQYHLNGRPITYGEFHGLEKELFMQRELNKLKYADTSERIEEYKQQLQAQLEMKDKAMEQAALNYRDTVAKYGLPFDAETFIEIRTGHRDQNPRTYTKKWQDAEGNRWESVIDLKTGNEFPGSRYQVPATAEDWKTRQYMLSHPGMTWAQAEALRAEEYMKDEKVKDSLRQAQLANARLTEESKQLANNIKKEGKTNQNVIKAYTKAMELAKAASRQPYILPDGSINPAGGMVDMDKAMMAAKGILQVEFGINWADVQKAFGGTVPTDSGQGTEAKGNAYLGSFGQGAGANTGTESTPGVGSIAYKPK